MGRQRKWPGKPHWHATEITFREIAGSSWRTAAAAAFVCDRRDTNYLQIETAVDLSDVPDAPFDASSLRPWEGIIRELMEDA